MENGSGQIYLYADRFVSEPKYCIKYNKNPHVSLEKVAHAEFFIIGLLFFGHAVRDE